MRGLLHGPIMKAEQAFVNGTAKCGLRWLVFKLYNYVVKH
jgi:hypothetical protein